MAKKPKAKPEPIFGGRETFEAAHQPHASREKAHDAVNEFWREVFELRVKHQIGNILCVLTTIDDQGEQVVSLRAGDGAREVEFASVMLGIALKARDERDAKLIVAARECEGTPFGDDQPDDLPAPSPTSPGETR